MRKIVQILQEVASLGFGASSRQKRDDVKRRAETAIKTLHERALVLAHPDQDHDMGQVLQALALILEIQRDLAREQKRIIARLGHQ
jgi:hypothetical protein